MNIMPSLLKPITKMSHSIQSPDHSTVLRDAHKSDMKKKGQLADSIDLALFTDPDSEGFLAANYTEEDYSKFIELYNSV